MVRSLWWRMLLYEQRTLLTLVCYAALLFPMHFLVLPPEYPGHLLYLECKIIFNCFNTSVNLILFLAQNFKIKLHEFWNMGLWEEAEKGAWSSANSMIVKWRALAFIVSLYKIYFEMHSLGWIDLSIFLASTRWYPSPSVDFKNNDDPQHLRIPCDITAIRSPRMSASSIWCVDNMIVRPERFQTGITNPTIPIVFVVPINVY